MSYTREPASASTHFRGIKVAATSSPGTTVHTGQASTSLSDIVTLYGSNSHATQVRKVTVEWGGTTSPDDHMYFEIPPRQTVILIPDLPIRNSLLVKVFADVANEVAIHPFVNVEA